MEPVALGAAVVLPVHGRYHKGINKHNMIKFLQNTQGLTRRKADKVLTFLQYYGLLQIQVNGKFEWPGMFTITKTIKKRTAPGQKKKIVLKVNLDGTW